MQDENQVDTHALYFVTTRLALVFPKNDGKQTLMKGHPVFIVLHATATCCKGSLWKWHRIEKGRLLTDYEIGFVVELVMVWIVEQNGPTITRILWDAAIIDPGFFFEVEVGPS